MNPIPSILVSLLLLLLGISSVFIAPCNGANILAMFPYPFYSHTHSYKPIIRELARRGHNITMVSPYPEKEKLANWTDIVISDLYPKTAEVTNDVFVKKSNGWVDIFNFVTMGTSMSKMMFNEPQYQKFLQDNSSKFDLVLAETFFFQEIMVAFGRKYNCPIVNMHPSEPFFLMSVYTGNLEPLSYVEPGHMETAPYEYNRNLTLTEPLSFYERFKFTVLHIIIRLVAELLYLPMQESWMRAYMNESNGFFDLPPLREMLTNTSLSLIDYHFSMGFQKPFHSNIIPVGGLTLDYVNSKLPPDLQKFMDHSKHGVVYFSFGSHFNITLLPEENRDAIIGALSKLKQDVIMKWPTKIDGLPKNVKVAQWWPQASILAHPKCVVFVTHGGLHGMYEAVHAGVPIVGIPIFGDQIKNILTAELNGFGIYIDRHEPMTEEVISRALHHVLYDPTYKAEAVKKSKIVMDRPISPKEEGVFWIEYVMRHKGAYFLKPYSVNLPLYKYLMLDVLGAIGCIIYLTVFIVAKVSKLFYRLCISKPKKVKKN